MDFSQKKVVGRQLGSGLHLPSCTTAAGPATASLHPQHRADALAWLGEGLTLPAPSLLAPDTALAACELCKPQTGPWGCRSSPHTAALQPVASRCFSEPGLEAMLCLPRACLFHLSQHLDFIVTNQREMLKNALPRGCTVPPCAEHHRLSHTTLGKRPLHPCGQPRAPTPRVRSPTGELVGRAPHHRTGTAWALGRSSEELCFNVAI